MTDFLHRDFARHYGLAAGKDCGFPLCRLYRELRPAGRAARLKLVDTHVCPDCDLAIEIDVDTLLYLSTYRFSTAVRPRRAKGGA